MPSSKLILIFTSFMFFFLLLLPTSLSYPSPAPRKSTQTHTKQQDLIRTSCVHARYPAVCLRTLSTYTGPTATPSDVARAALKVSLSRARALSSFLSSHSSSSSSSGKRERGALRDCIEQISDTVDELSQSLAELKHLRKVGGREAFGWAMSNAETWVSAALTDEDTCLEGFSEVGVRGKDEIRRKVRNVAKVTSNALYMINRLDQSWGQGKGSVEP